MSARRRTSTARPFQQAHLWCTHLRASTSTPPCTPIHGNSILRGRNPKPSSPIWDGVEVRLYSTFTKDHPALLTDNICRAGAIGRVPCLGARLAKLTLKLLTALLLVDFDFDTVDASGQIADLPPIPNWNDTLSCRPAQDQFFLKYKRLDSSYWSSETRPL